ncbi:hypothetical protein L9G16_23320, partial [Shewanella sp. A25]|nr:hypothetical protein [Shewanella shenzhenensis]
MSWHLLLINSLWGWSDGLLVCVVVIICGDVPVCDVVGGFGCCCYFVVDWRLCIVGGICLILLFFIVGIGISV